MGNSEVGHMNIGAGRVVMQDLPRIDAAIADGSLAQNPTLASFIARLGESGGTCHLMGLLSDGGVHAHQHHIIALAQIVAASGIPVCIHAFLDGRDTPPKSANAYLTQLESAIKDKSNITLATLSGRYYAMDRDNRWDRVQRAYRTLVHPDDTRADNAQSALNAAYAQELTDEFILPVALGDYRGMHDGDGLLMANFRADRARQLLHALLDPDFIGFVRDITPRFIATAGMVEYSTALAPLIPALFAPESLTNILGEVVAHAGLKQLRIAETEKYAHVTFFMSGGREAPFTGEDRILIPSPNVATYDLKPEMSAPELTDKLVEAITANTYDLIIVNYANTDMVGHSGNIKAAMAAVEAVDTCLGRLHDAVLKAGGALIISADHGNAEQMQDHASGQAHTAHTLNLVPAVFVGAAFKGQSFPVREGRLADLAPTVLSLMGLPKPTEMTGESLIPSEALHAARARA
jgi:2,3-bisphosphoglycerate-independent phosphoglycerate mutase